MRGGTTFESVFVDQAPYPYPKPYSASYVGSVHYGQPLPGLCFSLLWSLLLLELEQAREDQYVASM